MYKLLSGIVVITWGMIPSYILLLSDCNFSCSTTGKKLRIVVAVPTDDSKKDDCDLLTIFNFKLLNK